MEHLQAVVVGAGHAGLAASRQLTVEGVQHIVLERGRIGETWRSQRWASFRLNTSNRMNRLPGDETLVPEPQDAFQSAPAFADRLAGYAARHGLPVRERTAVVRVTPDDAGGVLVETAASGGGERDTLRARSLVVASGAQNVARVPDVAAAMPPWLVQVDALAYRRAADLPDGAVLVVGSGQTGGQLTDDLLDAGRRVYLSPSRVARCPRRYRGRDMLEWLIAAGFYDVPLERLTDPAMRQARQPLISGTGPSGHTLSLQSLAARGAMLVGRIWSVDGDTARLDDTIGECIRFGDAGSVTLRGVVDGWIEASGQPLPPPDDDPADEPHPDPAAVHSPEALDLRAAGIRTVIWATGVRGEFGWLPEGVLDPTRAPVHTGSATSVPGLFVLGLPWLTNRGSGIIYGIGGDAARIAGLVAERAAGR